MSPLVKKLFVSVGYAVAAAAPVFYASLPDGLTPEELGAVAAAVVAAFWAKFSSNTTVFAASREGETVAGPKP